MGLGGVSASVGVERWWHGPKGGLQHHTEEGLERSGELEGGSAPRCRPVSRKMCLVLPRVLWCGARVCLVCVAVVGGSWEWKKGGGLASTGLFFIIVIIMPSPKPSLTNTLSHLTSFFSKTHACTHRTLVRNPKTELAKDRSVR